jgi:ferritin-like metal-binding protein YciE
MPIASPRELFVHELSDVMSAEQIILKMLPQLQQEAKTKQVKDAFKQHEEETREQIEVLNQVFQELGEQPEQTTCYAAEGLNKEHEALLEEQPTPELLEMGNLGGAAKTEHYEIATYTTLVQMATNLGERKAVTLLRKNLRQEQAMRKQVEELAKQVGSKAK